MWEPVHPHAILKVALEESDRLTPKLVGYMLPVDINEFYSTHKH